MKKKIIKSYFFNKLSNKTCLFNFSKRAVKYRTRTKSLLSKQHTTLDAMKFYKYYTLYLSIYRNWIRTNKDLNKRFTSSFYKSILSRNIKKRTSSLKILYAWYRTKQTHTKITFKQLSKYALTGLLSSHFVHFLSKKNITYQNRSKYKTELRNTNSLNTYVYIYIHSIYNYVRLVEKDMYFFTSNHMQNNVITDDEFTRTFTNWCLPIKLESAFPKDNFGYINSVDYTWSTQLEITSKSTRIQQILYETDLSIKNKLIQELDLPNTIISSLIPFVNLYSTTSVCNHFYNPQNLSVIQFYSIYTMY